MEGQDGVNAPKDYPLVKIFNRIWIREDYQGLVKDGLSKCTGYYTDKSIAGSGIQGWEVASDKDFEQLKAGIAAVGDNSMPVRLLQNSGRSKETGFNLKWNGYMRTGSVHGVGEEMQYLVQLEGKSGEYGYVGITSNGTFDITKSYRGIDRLAVRYVLAD